MSEAVRPDGGAVLAEALCEVTPVVFTLHGGHLDPFFAACVALGIELVDFRHEAAAVNAADGYARTTGGLAVAAVTSGPGFSNAFAGLANAYADGVPLLLITSSPPLGESETNELQGGIDQIAAARPVTKWAHRVTHGDRIPDLVGLAARHALGGRPGPVVLELPIDVAFTPVDPSRISPGGPLRLATRPAPEPEAVRQLVDRLRQAERPVMVVGEGTLWSGADHELVAFAEHSGIPVFWSGPARRTLPSNHPLNGNSVAALSVLHHSTGVSPDVVMLLGSPLGLFTGGGPGGLIPEGAAMVQVDLDEAEMGRFGPLDLAINADCRQTLQALLAHPEPWPNRREWADMAVSAQRYLSLPYSEAPKMVNGRLHPYWAAREALSPLPPGAIVVTDGGEAAAWADTASGATEPHLMFRLGYQGHLGVGMGWAIGAQWAEPDRPVVQVTGDGAVGFHIQEIDTMVRHRLPIVTVVLSNDTWGMSIHGQDAILGPGRDIISRLAPVPYEDVARAFGAHGERVEQFEELAPAMARALAAGGPALVNVCVSNDIVHPVTTSLLGDLAATDEIIVPYYRNLPRR